MQVTRRGEVTRIAVRVRPGSPRRVTLYNDVLRNRRCSYLVNITLDSRSGSALYISPRFNLMVRIGGYSRLRWPRLSKFLLFFLSSLFLEVNNISEAYLWYKPGNNYECVINFLTPCSFPRACAFNAKSRASCHDIIVKRVINLAAYLLISVTILYFSLKKKVDIPLLSLLRLAFYGAEINPV